MGVRELFVGPVFRVLFNAFLPGELATPNHLTNFFRVSPTGKVEGPTKCAVIDEFSSCFESLLVRSSEFEGGVLAFKPAFASTLLKHFRAPAHSDCSKRYAHGAHSLLQ
jgi:hypothetical protein